MNPRSLLIVLLVATFACSGTTATARPTSRQPTLPQPSPSPTKPPTLVEQGRRLLIGDGVPQDRRRALVLFERACKQGDLPGCVAISNFASDDDDRGYGQIIERSLRSQCMGGSVLACRYAGAHWYDVDNEAPALCKQGLVYACGLIAYEKANRHRIPDLHQHFNPAATKLLVEACKMGHAVSCEVVSNRDETSPYHQRALELQEVGCRAGYPRDCDAIDDSEQTRMCVDQLDAYACRYAWRDDPQVERRMREFGCALDESQCHALGEFAQKEQHDLDLARRAYMTGCEAKLIEDCVAAAHLFEPVDRKRAKALRDRADALRDKEHRAVIELNEAMRKDECRASVPPVDVDCSGLK